MNSFTSKVKTLPIFNVYSLGPILLLLPLLMFSEPLYAIFGEENYIGIHLIIEIFLIVTSLTIAVQAWLISPFILSSQRLYLGALFLAVGIFEIAHTMSYKGMPFFFLESSSYSATWFYIVGRLTQAIGLLVILVIPGRQISEHYRWYVYIISIMFAMFWIGVVYYPTSLLPQLVIDGQGLTSLKIVLQYVAIASQLMLIVFLVKTYKQSRTRNTIVILSSIYLILSDSMFTTYKTVYDIQNFIGHIFQLFGYYYLLRSLYYASVERPFKDLIKTQGQLESSVYHLEQVKNKLEQSEADLHYMAYHDELTELPNARSLTEQLGNTIYTNSKQFAIIMVEIDRLKSIKESLGLSFSDVMITKVAERLRQTLPKNVFIGKLREGEFMIIVSSIETTEPIDHICSLIQNAMKEPFQIQHFALNCTVNIGIAMYPIAGETEEDLIKHAQIAMREAQKETKRTLYYEPSMEKKLIEKLILEQDLHYALGRGEIYLEYQPKVNIATGTIESVEALLRWKHPEKGNISPMVFIPIAEESGLIVPIGKWVLETACRQAKKWQEAGFENLGVGVNLSIRQFYQQDLVEMIDQILQQTGLESNYLELEITESMTMNTNYAIKTLKHLKTLGVNIAVDDFGTGYSSLSYLKDFPIDCLKMDRSFVRNIDVDEQGAVLASMIISMAKHLQLKIVAEGVEEVHQLSFLSTRKCDLIQGYLFSKPLTIEELVTRFNEIQQNAQTIVGQYTEEVS